MLLHAENAQTNEKFKNVGINFCVILLLLFISISIRLFVSSSSGSTLELRLKMVENLGFTSGHSVKIITMQWSLAFDQES